MKIIILAGGLGKRLWPMSIPKQFSHFFGKETLFQKTLRRFLQQYLARDLLIVTRNELLPLARKQALEIDKALASRIIEEPKAKNTAPATLFALKWLQEHHELGSTFLVAPSDHLIAPESLFLKQLHYAQKIGKEGSHILFGLFPTYPHTGYGYIRCNPEESLSSVECFIEKPNQILAQKLLEEGNCLWNSGIFLFHTQQFFKDLTLYQLEMAKAFEKNAFESLPSISLDHAFLEFSDNLKVIPLHLSWSDVGSWDSIYELLEKDSHNNAKFGDIHTMNTKNSLIISQQRPIRTIDIENLIIVESEDGLLVAHRDSSEKVSKQTKMLIRSSSPSKLGCMLFPNSD